MQLQRLCSSLSGAYLSGNGARSTSKPQRPTSLPIQPFVLVPTGKTGAPQAGCLLEHYMNRKSSKVSASQPGSKFKGRRSRCFSSLQLSPMGSHYPVFLEPPSSSDTCSSCTPSPEWMGRRHTWSQSGSVPEPFRPCTRKSGAEARRVGPKHARVQPLEDTSPRSEISLTPSPPPNRPALIKIPTYQDLNRLTPKLNYTSAFPLPTAHTSHHSRVSQTPPTPPMSAAGHGSSPSTPTKPEERPLLPPRDTPAADPGFFHGRLTAAFSSLAPLASLSSLLSFAASARTSHPGESLVLSDKPPTEFCLSPDASYESMSISHLQRRGETLATASHSFTFRGGLSPRDDELLCSSAFNTPEGDFLSNMTYF